MDNKFKKVRLRWEILSPDVFEQREILESNITKVSSLVEDIFDIYVEKTTEKGKLIYIRDSKTDRETAHREGLLHAGVQVWVYNSKGEILIQKRSLIKDSSPGLWDISSAGHLEAGDTMISWAIREVEEELWICIKPEELNLIAWFRNEVKKILGDKTSHNNEIIAVFLLKYDGNISQPSSDNKEVDEIKFISLKELEEDWKDEERLKIYTSKGEEYRKMIIENLKRVC